MVQTRSSTCIAAHMCRTSALTGCCYISSSTKSIIEAKHTLCLAEHMSHRRSSMNFSQSPKYRCARLSSRSLDGRRKEFGESETALKIVPMHRAAPCSPAQTAGPCQGADSNNEGNRQTVPSGNEKRRIIRAMRCIKRRADSSSKDRRSPGKRRMFWCSLA
jgi:hypothetical protein